MLTLHGRMFFDSLATHLADLLHALALVTSSLRETGGNLSSGRSSVQFPEHFLSLTPLLNALHKLSLVGLLLILLLFGLLFALPRCLIVHT